MRRQAWFAIIVCLFAMIPGFIGGALASMAYKASAAWSIGYDPDVLFMRSLFGIEAPGAILKWIFFSFFPAAMHGGFAGAIAIWITSAVCKGANMDIPAYSVGLLMTAVGLAGAAIAFARDGFELEIIELIGQLLGLWVGLIAAALSVPKQAPIPGQV